MKTLSLFTAFILVLAVTASSQKVPMEKKNTAARSASQEVIYTPVLDPLPVNDLNSGSGGAGTYFYYGDPTGMYLDDEWKEGSARVQDGKILEGDFRYNIYHQQMQAIRNGDTFAFARPEELEWLKIDGRKFVYTTFMRESGEVAASWFEVLCDGDCCLLLRRYIKYRMTDGDDDHTNDQLYKLDEYYAQKGSDCAERLNLSRKEILRAMKDHREEVEDFIKSERLKLRHEEDLVRLVAYYNSLD